MSLEKAIQHGKEYRKKYQGNRKSSAFDWSCRNNGRCAYCRHNRLFNRKKTELESVQDIKEWKMQID